MSVGTRLRYAACWAAKGKNHDDEENETGRIVGALMLEYHIISRGRFGVSRQSIICVGMVAKNGGQLTILAW